MHIVQVTTAISTTGAGVHESIRGLTTHLVKLPKVRVTVAGVAGTPSAWEHDQSLWKSAGVDVIASQKNGVRGAAWMLNTLPTLLSSPIDIVHAHGLWDGALAAGARLAQRHGCPLVFSPHGMLAPWAFHHRWLKKQLPWRLWERSLIVKANLLQAMSQLETDSFRAHGLLNPVAIHPIGLDQRQVQPRESRTAGSRTCLFLSRLHPVKGLPLLLQAWARASPRGMRLVVAGPGSNSYRAELERLANDLRITDSVSFREGAYGAEKWRLLADADLFVLPSLSENFGLVVAEALAAGLPVITTTAAPWEILEREKIGWHVAPAEATIAAALSAAAALPAAELTAMGTRAAAVANRDFQWPVIAAAMSAAYEWAIAGGPPPACIQFPSA